MRVYNQSAIDLSGSIMSCRRCKDGCFQTMPQPFLYSCSSKALVIAQNPGMCGNEEIEAWHSASHDSTLERIQMYEKYFLASRAYSELGRLYFGHDWLRGNGPYSYTNIVHCRTRNNGTPSLEMINNCLSYTKKLIDLRNFKLIICVGALARQHIGWTKEWNKLYRQRETGRLHIAVMHYSAGVSSRCARIARNEIKRAFEIIDGDVC